MKTPFKQLKIEVDRLFEKGLTIPPTDDVQINEHCDMIMKFIEANGWTTDDYTAQTFRDFDITNLN